VVLEVLAVVVLVVQREVQHQLELLEQQILVAVVVAQQVLHLVRTSVVQVVQVL
jgi:hypothetical protein